MQSPFARGWWSFDLGRYRACSGTYELYPYDSLPPLDESLFRGDFAWLGPVRAVRGKRKPPAIVAAAQQQGVALPAAFVKFVGDPSLAAAVPSCTACEWDPSDAPVPCRVVEGAYTVRFLRDQQDCLFWYLHLLPDGDAHVLCSPIPFDDPDVVVERDVVIANTWYCAPHFEQFVHRFWIENELSLKGSKGELTPEQRAYIGHYQAQIAASEAEKAKTKAAKQQAAKKKTAAKKETAAKKSAAKKSAAKKSAVKKASKTSAAKKSASKKPPKKAAKQRNAAT